MLKTSVTVADLQTKVAELEKQNADLATAAEAHASAITSKDTKISELEGKVAELNTAAGSHASAIEAKDASIKTLEGEKATLTGDKTTLEGEVAELKKNAKTVETAADEKAREIAARNGANLPAKQPGAGDSTTDDAGKATGTWRERVSSFWKVRE
ncbi:MAG TPA: hypothetical protein VHW03_04515 [Chthoniobacterales bacterium]|jgi:chromosome segregation ATPase|nr:hypothetical protein [Chthoniobacterales bacterium]